MRSLKLSGLFCGIFFLLAPISCWASAQAQNNAPSRVLLNGMDQALATEIENLTLKDMEEWHSPGLGVGIVQGSTLVFAGYFGYANLEEKTSVTEDTLFRIGSISKGLTAIGLMQQWEQGKINLDQDVNKYLPKTLIHPPHPDTNPVTMRHLLTHTSGIGEFLSYEQLLMKGQGVQVQGDNYLPLEHYLRLGVKTRYNPGLYYSYSNYGFTFVGLALETIAGQPFNQYQIEHVFKPLGMNDTTYEHKEDQLPRIITGYKWQDGKYTPDRFKAFGITPSGNIFSTVNDFGRYIIALLNNGCNRHGCVIKPETLEMMTSMQYTEDPYPNHIMPGYGFGFRIYGEDIWGYKIVGHSGSVPFGFTSQMLMVPEKKLGVFVFANTNKRAPTKICWDIIKKILDIKNEPPAIIKDSQSNRDMIGFYGPQYRQLKTNARIYLDGIGSYRIDEIDGQLVIYGTWEGKEKAKHLYQVKMINDKPGLYWIEDPDADCPQYLFYHRGGEFNSDKILLEGYSSYSKLGPIRKPKAMLLIPLGKMISKENPL